MPTARALFLSDEELTGLATPGEHVDVVRSAYAEHGRGAPVGPRTSLAVNNPPGKLTNYMAILPETGVMGLYSYSAGFGSTDAYFVLPLYDATTGAPLAVLDGARLNPHKTGAVGAVGVDTLARPDTTSLGLLGSGAQSRAQARAISSVRDLTEVTVYSPTPEHRERFAEEMSKELDPPVTAVSSSSAAIDGADIVVTATDSSEPVFPGDQLDPGTHVTAIGQYDSDKRELDARTIQRATYVPDISDRVITNAGSFITALEEGAIAESHVHAELGEVMVGTATGRKADDEITVFDSGGTAIETLASAYLVYQRAKERGLGTPIEFAPASEAIPGRAGELEFSN
jgi:alanine dehydrogenase